MKPRTVLLLFFALCSTACFSQAAKPPIMGWSSWNQFHVNIDEKLIKEQADALVSSGMYAAGYRYINIDDGYFGGRDTSGKLIPNAQKFPHGMKVVADYVHSKGLKAGIYSDAGSNTCGSMWDKDSLGVGVGLHGHIEQDCRLFFTEWGYNFLKVDWCGGEKLKLDEATEYLKIIAVVRQLNPNATFNVCRWKFPGEWVIKKADSWRISGDISNKFSSILGIIDLDADLYKYASAGHYNDMDMLQVGRGMTYDEDKTHFSMWCMLNSPLLAGNDLRDMSKQTISILTNTEVIALNQDPRFVQARRMVRDNDIEIWTKPLGKTGEAAAIAILNRSNEQRAYALRAATAGLSRNSSVRDLWLHKDLGELGDSRQLSLPPHGIVVLKAKTTRLRK